jgi:hypothetical protein
MSEISRQKDSSGKKSPYYGTKVDVEKSKTQIRDLLMKYGVSQQRWTEDLENNQVMFEFFIKGNDRTYLVRLMPKPFIEEHRLWNSKKGKSETMGVPNWARAYRMLYAYVKAKVEAIAYGMHTIEEEFMPDIIVKNSQGQEITLADAILKSNEFAPMLDYKG